MSETRPISCGEYVIELRRESETAHWVLFLRHRDTPVASARELGVVRPDGYYQHPHVVLDKVRDGVDAKDLLKAMAEAEKFGPLWGKKKP